MIRVTPQVIALTIYGTADLPLLVPCTSNIAEGVFGMHRIINNRAIASFWKSRGERFNVDCIACCVIARYGEELLFSIFL